MSLPDFSLKGRVAIVTGARRGIGREIALTFAESGADVAVCDVVVEDGQLEAVAKEIREFGRRALATQVDITKKAGIDNMVQKVADEFGAVDVLVNNAGILVVIPFMEHEEKDWDQVMDTNLKGYFLCAQAMGKLMVDQEKGSIINIASVRAFRGSQGRVSYCVSKAGVLMLTRVMALEFANYNIRVNGIAPGWIKTKLNEQLWSAPNNLKQIEATIPLGYLAEPSAVSGAALFLASDASSYITGHTIVVDGGYLA